MGQRSTEIYGTDYYYWCHKAPMPSKVEVLLGHPDRLAHSNKDKCLLGRLRVSPPHWTGLGVLILPPLDSRLGSKHTKVTLPG